MYQRLALYAPEGEGAAGGGAPAGESGQPGSGEQPPKDGEWIPKARFDEAIGGLKDKNRELQAQLQALNEKLDRPAPETPKRFTRAELKEAVKSGQLSEDDADAIYDRQVREELRHEAQQTAHQTVTQAERKRQVDSQIAQYKQLKPDILVDGSETRQSIAEEYNFLVSMGDPTTVETELKAIRAVLGPVEKLRAAAAGRPAGESHQDTGGGPQGGPGPRPKGGKLTDTLSSREKSYYQGMIDKGQYKDWAEVEETLKFAKPEIRRKHGAAV